MNCIKQSHLHKKMLFPWQLTNMFFTDMSISVYAVYSQETLTDKAEFCDYVRKLTDFWLYTELVRNYTYQKKLDRWGCASGQNWTQMRTTCAQYSIHTQKNHGRCFELTFGPDIIKLSFGSSFFITARTSKYFLASLPSHTLTLSPLTVLSLNSQ